VTLFSANDEAYLSKSARSSSVILGAVMSSSTKAGFCPRSTNCLNSLHKRFPSTPTSNRVLNLSGFNRLSCRNETIINPNPHPNLPSVQDVSDAPAHFDSGNPQSQGAIWVAYPRCVRTYHFAGQLGCRKVVVEVL